MHNSFLLSEAASPHGTVILIVYGCLLIVSALFFSRVHTRKFFSGCNICKESKNRTGFFHTGNALAKKDQDDECVCLER